MTSPSTPDSDELEPLAAAAPRRAWNLGRVLAAIAGVALLTVVSIYTLGFALLAPLGMVATRFIARRQKFAVTPGKSWIGAALSVSFALTVAAAVAALEAPAGTFANITRATDSVSTASKQKPPPAWLDRIAPGASARARAAPAKPTSVTRAFMVWSLVVGGVFACTLFAVVIGTAGWAPSLLLSYAFTGRWIPGS